MTTQLDQRPSRRPAAGSSLASRLLSPRSFAIVGVLTGVILLVFRTWPDLDLVAASWFYTSEHRFVATQTAERMRSALYITPWIVIGTTVAFSVVKHGSKVRRGWAPSRRGLAVMMLSLALGPGLLVNAILKDNVHRPRPHQVAEFGGPLRFRPAGDVGGGCSRNCSFVSGEVSAAAWTVSAALLVPISIQPLAVAAAVVLTSVAGLWRMAVGAHFLSDALLAMTLTWLVVIVTWWAVFGWVDAVIAGGSSRTRAAA